MTEEENLYQISDDITETITEDLKGNNVQKIVYQDASSETAKVLVPQMGSDKNTLAKGEYDTRRFTNISLVDVLWLSWFETLPKKYGGAWAKQFAEEYRNHAYSINAQNKKLVVSMQQAVSGGREKSSKKKDDRNWLQRNLTQRNKESEELYDIAE